MRPKLRLFRTVLGALAFLSFLSVTAQGQAFGASESILWDFGNGTDGTEPTASLIMDSHGNLYGTARQGGTNDNHSTDFGGVVFELSPPAIIGGPWTEAVLWNFGSGSDGTQPAGNLIMDADGNLYGTTSRGGAFASASDVGGTVFELTPHAGGPWTESILWSFGNGTDGKNPLAGLIMDKNGNLYGTTFSGGTDNMGTVFELISAGGGWTESVLWSFNGTDGKFPVAGLIMDSTGNLYSTTQSGGSPGGGTVFELTPQAGGSWTESIIWSFNPGSLGTKDGFSPSAGVIMDASGNIYGTTALGGAYFKDPGSLKNFGGTAFKLMPPSSVGGTWTESILRNFGKGKDGVNLLAGLIIDKSGNLYGTTQNGGASGSSNGPGGGTLFSLTPPRSAKGSWTESIVWSFGGNGNDGDSPNAAVIMDTSGNLFGTTEHGGTHNTAGGGTVFEISSVLTGSPATLNFGKVVAPGTSKPKRVTLTNKDTLPAPISSVTATAPFKIGTAANTCSGQIIAPKKHCSFEVEFAPTAVGDVTDGSIDVTYNGASPAVALAGNGT